MIVVDNNLLSEQEVVRREKMEELVEKGINPFASGFKPKERSLSEFCSDFFLYDWMFS